MTPTEYMPNNSDQFFRTIVEKSTNYIFLFSPKRKRFIYANNTLLNTLGYRLEEFLSVPYEEIIAEQHQNQMKRVLTSLIQKGQEVVSFEVDLLNTNSACFPTQFTLENIQKKGKDLILGIGNDLSLHNKTQEQLEEQNRKYKQLQLTNKYRSAFFSNLSHEMRTTLTSTLLLSDILSKNHTGNLNEEQIKYISTIRHSTTSLLSLLNEVLDFSKIESGKMSMRAQNVDITNFCKELERLFQPVANHQGIRFEVINELKENLPFITDGLRLEQVLKNLISNALKFTSDGFVKLRILRSDTISTHNNLENALSSKILFEVSDSGIGIPEDQQEAIFQSYIQAEGAQNHTKGTGLGLSISKEITELLGGRIEVKSVPGKGSVFTLVLPIDSSNVILKNAEKGKIKLTTVPTTGDHIKESTKKKKSKKINGSVLLVDDSETHNMALSEFLNFKIKNITSVNTAKEAFQILAKQKFDCIVLDMYLPDISGKEVLKQIKNDKDLRSIPVIIYSGKSISQNEEDELESLADAIIQKNTMSYKILLRKVVGVLRKALEPMK